MAGLVMLIFFEFFIYPFHFHREFETSSLVYASWLHTYFSSISTYQSFYDGQAKSHPFFTLVLFVVLGHSLLLSKIWSFENISHLILVDSAPSVFHFNFEQLLHHVEVIRYKYFAPVRKFDRIFDQVDQDLL